MAISDEEIKVFDEFCRLTCRNAQDYSALDSPDFVSTGHGIAVELTGYHQDQNEGGSGRRRADQSAKNLVESAKIKYQNTSDDPVSVFVHMHNSWMAEPKNVNRCASDLADVVVLHRKEEVVLERNDLPDELKNVVSWVSINPTRSRQEEPVWSQGSASIIEVNIPAVQKALDMKETKIPIYRKHAPNVELLIFSSPWPCVGIPSMGNASTCGGITDELRRFVFESSFDKVHYLDRHRDEVIELRLKKPSTT